MLFRTNVTNSHLNYNYDTVGLPINNTYRSGQNHHECSLQLFRPSRKTIKMFYLNKFTPQQMPIAILLVIIYN